MTPPGRPGGGAPSTLTEACALRTPRTPRAVTRTTVGTEPGPAVVSIRKRTLKRLLDPAPSRAIDQHALPCRTNEPGAETNDEAVGTGVQTRTRLAAPGPRFRTSIVVRTSPPGRTVLRLFVAVTVSLGFAGESGGLNRAIWIVHVAGLLAGTGSVTGEVAFDWTAYAPALAEREIHARITEVSDETLRSALFDRWQTYYLPHTRFLCDREIPS